MQHEQKTSAAIVPFVEMQIAVLKFRGWYDMLSVVSGLYWVNYTCF